MLEIQSLKLTLVSPGVVYWLIGPGPHFSSEILVGQGDDKRRRKTSVLGAGLRGFPVVQNEGLWRGLLDCKQTPVYC